MAVQRGIVALLVLVALFMLLLPGAAPAQVPARDPALGRPAAASGTAVVPGDFLRRWDPVTVFFARDLGPAAGGPEDTPERLVTVTPPHPGAFTWLDARTLQFKPAEPWPPLTRFTWRVNAGGGADTTVHLATLMAPPVATEPADGSEGLDPVAAVTLRFAEPLDAGDLARAVSLELRPLPGIDGAGARRLDGDDFEVKVMERADRDAPATYVLTLEQPIPAGTRALVRFQLSLEPALAGDEGPFSTVRFATAQPFRPVAFGCPASRFPVTPEGSRYTPDQAIRCPGAPRLVVDFSAPPQAVGPLAGRALVRLEPAVDNLRYELAGRQLLIAGDFARDTRYRVRLAPASGAAAAIVDAQERPLVLAGASELYLFFPSEDPYLRWLASGGLVERRGPQMLPLAGRGSSRLDLRLYRVDPLDRSFWPFPEQPVAVDEHQRPPGPGEAPEPFTDVSRTIAARALARQIHSLGSPPLSSLVDLPMRRRGGAATFGLDVEDALARVGGRGAAGSYLVGLRPLDGSHQRTWMRVQVSDLALTTVEEPRRVVFVVTSLASARPVAGARVRLEGRERSQWATFFEGVTDDQGRLEWPAPGFRPRVQLRRLVVAKDDDVLVLDPSRPPDVYADNAFTESRHSWLSWVFEDLEARGPQAERVGHLFAERPVYRPEQPVHLKGFLRQREGGRLRPLTEAGTLVVAGPGDLEWRYPLQPSARGSIYRLFDEEKLPTGVYRAHFELDDGRRLGRTTFRKEAYRLPRFEVQLHGPPRPALDQAFDVELTASYYAGGRVSGRPVQWRVTQFPYTWQPRERPGYVFASDGRFSRLGPFEARPALERQDTTDDDGHATIAINPALEPTAHPRTYVVEATVTGADDQTVTNTRRLVALPPFLLGLKVPRYLERAEAVRPEIVLVDRDDRLLAGQAITVRLIHRQWHSHLQASDFSDGVARYVTDVVEETIATVEVESAAEPLSLELPLAEAGVYVVEVEARDRLGRAQVVAVDFFAGGGEAVAWPKPSTRVFKVTADHERYRPGDTANLVLASPFQEARVLAVVEAPEGNRYRWLEVDGGQASLAVEVLGTYTPRLPVHFVLMRGRLEGTRPIPGNRTDLGKPTTLASTAWLQVEPVDNRAEVTLVHPEQALPGQTVEVEVALADPHGRPLAGEVTLWLVDQAVLALGQEQRLDPLPDFITPVNSHLAVHDTRNLAFGQLPFAEQPGGGEGEARKGLLDRQTVRRNFQPVPFYAPAVEVDASGRARVAVALPDNLTNFALRAKAIAGGERFGYATGVIEVRLPVIIQPALPRFVRPGDRFLAAAVSRVVEGDGGAGRVEASFEGLEVEGASARDVTLDRTAPLPVRFPVSVPLPPLDAAGAPAYDAVRVTIGVERVADRVGDAFSVSLPIRPDRQPVRLRAIGVLQPLVPFALPAIEEPARPGSVQRTVLIADRPALVRMADGLDFLLAYPYGCTEQRLSEARARLALRAFRDVLHLEGDDQDLDRAVTETLDWIAQVVQPTGLAAYWPGSEGYVALTAWVLEFLVEARDAGYPVDDALWATLSRALEQALRSDYRHFVDGESWAERAWALRALAAAGRFDAAYGAELARKAANLDLEGVAGVVVAFDRAGERGSPAIPPLVEALWQGIVFRLHQGREIFGGLQQRRSARNRLILPSETRTVADMVRALGRTTADDPRFSRLVDALVGLGEGDGWGSTNANAAALLALTEVLQPPFADSVARSVQVALPGQVETVALGPEAPTALVRSGVAGAGSVRLIDGGGDGGRPLVVRAESRYLPAADGSRVAPRRDGFVVSRAQLHQGTSPPGRTALDQAGTVVTLAIGDVVEEHVRVVNPGDRHFVAVVVPLAAGVEALNPALATAPPEARPAGTLTRPPTYVAFLDDAVSFYYNVLPAGSYDFYLRTRATVAGSFIQPPARAEMMYDGAVVGTSAGARLEVVRAEDDG